MARAWRLLVRRAAARVGPLVPERLAERVLQARAWAGEGVALGLPDVARVLVLAPHPDDETIACGGTVALLADAGARIELLVASDGEATLGSGLPPEQIAAARRAEVRRAADALGIADVRFLGAPDLGLSGRVDVLATALGEAMRRLDPELVLVPWFLDGTADHRALALALARARPGQAVEVWGGEVWQPLPANRLVDVSAGMDRKRAALACHVTAHGAFDLEAMLGLSRYRSVQGFRGRGHAEAYLAVPGPTWTRLTEEALELRDGVVRARSGA